MDAKSGAQLSEEHGSDGNELSGRNTHADVLERLQNRIDQLEALVINQALDNQAFREVVQENRRLQEHINRQAEIIATYESDPGRAFPNKRRAVDEVVSGQPATKKPQPRGPGGRPRIDPGPPLPYTERQWDMSKKRAASTIRGQFIRNWKAHTENGAVPEAEAKNIAKAMGNDAVSGKHIGELRQKAVELDQEKARAVNKSLAEWLAWWSAEDDKKAARRMAVEATNAAAAASAAPAGEIEEEGNYEEDGNYEADVGGFDDEGGEGYYEDYLW